MQETLPLIVCDNSDIEITEGGKTHSVKLSAITIHKPAVDGVEILPWECRVRRISYQNQVTANIHHEVFTLNENGDQKLVQRNVSIAVPIFRLPCMVGSVFCSTNGNSMAKRECPLDQGGYFIINGCEKCLLSQLKLRGNMTFVFKSKKTSKYSHMAEVRSVHPGKWRSTSTMCIEGRRDIMTNKCHARVRLPFLMCGSTTQLQIPIMCLWRAVEYSTGQPALSIASIMGMILGNNTNRSMRVAVESILYEKPFNTLSQQECMSWLVQSSKCVGGIVSRQRNISHILLKEFLPHHESTNGKLEYTSSMIRHLLSVVLGHTPPCDRDNNAFKRLDGTGHLIAIIFRQLFRNHLKQIHKSLERSIKANKSIHIPDFMQPRRIEVGLQYHFATGTWSINRNSNNGVCQIMNRQSMCATLSHLRRTSIPLNRDGKAPLVRQLHPTDWRLFCAAETPEGTGVGLIKNLAILAHITQSYPSKLVSDIVVRILNHDKDDPIPVMVNGVIVCRILVVAEAMETLREHRRSGGLAYDISISYNAHTQTVAVYCDGGRMCSPVFLTSRIGDVCTALRSYQHDELWDGLVYDGIVEYLDKTEEENCIVAPNVAALGFNGNGYTHCEIDNTAIFGPTTACIPFSEFNQAPRNIYQASMHKQAIGVPVLNYTDRYDTGNMYVLHHPTRPLATTRVGKESVINWDNPTGLSPIVAICTAGGENQEDSIVISKKCLELGFARMYTFMTFRADLSEASSELFEIPGMSCVGRRGDADYSKLDEADGIVPLGIHVVENDVIIGRTSLDNGRRHDRSIVVPANCEGVVDSVIMTQNAYGAALALVKVRAQLVPEIGDKFSSRHGQKGTIGCIQSPEDMPFNIMGMTPDIIVNPHAIPSRMTVGHLVEMLSGKTMALDGNRSIDGTPFEGISVEDIGARLRNHGHGHFGKEVLYSGITGQRLEALVFMGPCYYQRLKHLVKYKWHSRGAHGPVSQLTRQPVEGRSRAGRSTIYKSHVVISTIYIHS